MFMSLVFTSDCYQHDWEKRVVQGNIALISNQLRIVTNDFTSI